MTTQATHCGPHTNVKTPCVGKRTGLIKEFNPITHQCKGDILIIAQNISFANRNVKERILNGKRSSH